MIRYFLTFIFIAFLCKLYSQNQIPQHLECVKINHLYRKACHNCYEPQYAQHFYNTLNETRVIELDVHTHKVSGSQAPVGVWYVRHNPNIAFSNSNNLNNCDNQYGYPNQNFNICMENVQSWSINNSNHNPIIIFIDLKQRGVFGNSGPFWRGNHQPQDLDGVLRQFALDMGGLDVVYKPSDLKGSFAELRFAAFNENWPSLGNLKNKFIFVLTGDNGVLNDYLTDIGSNAMAFVAPKLDDENPSFLDLMYPSKIWPSNWQHIVFYNFEDTQIDDAKNFIPNHGFVSRSWENGNTTLSEYGNNIFNNVNNIAIKNFTDNNIATNMNYQLIGINNILVAGTSQYPNYIASYYDNILQHALIKVTTENLIVLPNTNYNIRAGQEVDLLPGTDIQTGVNTDISIGDCASYASNLRIGNTDNTTKKETLSNNQNLNTKRNQDIESQNKEGYLAFITYPNPTKNIINVSYKFNNLITSVFYIVRHNWKYGKNSNLSTPTRRLTKLYY